MKETFYFAHDFNAHDDSKIKKLIRTHGHNGYGIYWHLIELLASETGRWYLRKDYDGIAFEMRTECNCIKSVIEDFGLFEFDDKNFWNKRLDMHFDERAKKSEQAKLNAQKRWNKQAKNATALQTECKGNAIKERKGKEKKGKEKKENNIKKDVVKINIKKKNKFIPPTLQEVIEWSKTCGHDIDSEKIFRYYNDADWKDSKGKQVLNWKQKIRGVWCNSENKTKIISNSW